MTSSQKRKPARKRSAPEANRKAEMPEQAHPSPEDERDLQDALRARDEAKRKGVYPWDWLKQEIEA